MELTLSGTFAQKLLSRATNDKGLVRELAKELIVQKDPLAMAHFLLTEEVVVELLVERLKKTPEQTLRQVEQLQPRDGAAPWRRAAKSARRKKNGRKQPGRKKTAKKRAKTARKAKGTPAPKRRRRLSKQQIERLKQRVVEFLREHGWASRKQVIEGAGIPTPSIYSRVMGELREAGKVKAKGDKAKRLYALKKGR